MIRTRGELIVNNYISVNHVKKEYNIMGSIYFFLLYFALKRYVDAPMLKLYALSADPSSTLVYRYDKNQSQLCILT